VIYLVTTLLPFTISIVMLVVSFNIDWERFFQQHFAVSLLIVVFGYHYMVYGKSVRMNWLLGIQLSDRHTALCSLLYDLMPSATARKFMLQRQVHHEVLNLSIETSPPSMSCSQEEYAHAVVLCSDLVEFTPLSELLKPEQVMILLHELWTVTDSLVEECAFRSRDVVDYIPPFKMDTIGDAYIVVKMLPNTEESKYQALVEIITLARMIMRAVDDFSTVKAPLLLGLPPGKVKMRMGLAFDTIVAGVLGYLQPRFHVYGKALKKATVLESTSKMGCLHVCEETRKCVKELKGKAVICLLHSSSDL